MAQAREADGVARVRDRVARAQAIRCGVQAAPHEVAMRRCTGELAEDTREVKWAHAGALGQRRQGMLRRIVVVQQLACRIDAGNGRLKPSGVFASCPSPVCVKFLPPVG